MCPLPLCNFPCSTCINTNKKRIKGARMDYDNNKYNMTLLPIINKFVNRMPYIYEEIINKSSCHFQMVSWEILSRSISALVKKIKYTSLNDIPKIKNKLLGINLITGKGLLCTHIIDELLESETDATHKYAFLMSLINSVFSGVGILLLKRCIHDLFCEIYGPPQDKNLTHCTKYLSFISNLINYGLAHPIVAVDLVQIFLQTPNEETISMVYTIIHTCGHQMRKMCSVQMDEIANTDVKSMKITDGGVEFKIDYTIFQLIKNNKYGSVKFPTIGNIDYKHTHVYRLKRLSDYIIDPEKELDCFDYETAYDSEIYRLYYKNFILTEKNQDNFLLIYDTYDGLEHVSRSNYDVDDIPRNMRFIKQTILSMVMDYFIFDYFSSAWKLFQLKIKPGQESMLCSVFIELCCTSETKNFTQIERVGYITQIFVQFDEFLVKSLEQTFSYNYSKINTFDTLNAIRLSKYFAHLLFSDTISWDVLSIIEIDKIEKTVIIEKTLMIEKIEKNDKIDASNQSIQTEKIYETLKIYEKKESPQLSFVKTLFLELLDHLGYDNLANRICSEFNIKAFEKIFLVDGAIEFFQSIKMEKFVDMYRNSYNSMKQYLKDN